MATEYNVRQFDESECTENWSESLTGQVAGSSVKVRRGQMVLIELKMEMFQVKKRVYGIWVK